MIILTTAREQMFKKRFSELAKDLLNPGDLTSEVGAAAILDEWFGILDEMAGCGINVVAVKAEIERLFAKSLRDEFLEKSNAS